MNNFIWSASTVAFQIEGGRSKLDRKPSIWDKFTKDNFFIPKDGDPSREINSVEDAANFFENYEKDAAIMANIKMNGFVYSLDWSRIIDGPNLVSSKGIEFYEKVFKIFYDKGVKILPVLFHWDTPLFIEKEGGFLNDGAIAHFSFFAKTVFKYLGKYCDIFFTSNENSSFSIHGYLGDYFPPQKNNFSDFVKAQHILNLCNASAKIEFNEAKKKGFVSKEAKLGIIHDWSPAIPYETKDIASAKIYNEILLELFLSPNLKGSYPKAFIDLVKEKGIEFKVSTKEKLLLSNTLDLIGWNYYRPAYVATNNETLNNTNWHTKPETPFDYKFAIVYPMSAKYTKWNWLIDPSQIVSGAKHINKIYPNIPIMITENGIGEIEKPDDSLIDDVYRIDYLSSHIDEVLKAKNEFGINIIGYSLWTYCDVFSPSGGYRKKYGLVKVLFDNKYRRIPKLSYVWYKNVISNNKTNFDINLLKEELLLESKKEIFK